MPFLLEALDDNTPTKLRIKLGGVLTWMHFATELSGNPANEVEQAALAALPEPEPAQLSEGGHHTLTLGDVCYVIIGQIVNRPYEAVRYQPTGGVVINSPTRNPTIARVVRAAWTSGDSAKHLLQSLLVDYSTRGVRRGRGLDGWGYGSHFQVGAAMRLLYYFPREAAPLVARRLQSLKVNVGPSAEAWQNRELANGTRTVDFIRAVSWCKHPKVRSALVGIFKRSREVDIAVAALPAVPGDDEATARRQLECLLDRQPPGEDRAFGPGFHLLRALGQRGGAEARKAFVEYLRVPTIERRRTMARVLRETRTEWAVDLLSPYLTDKRTFGWTYAPGLEIRVCDEVAETLSRVVKDISFQKKGTHADLDRQISLLVARLKEKAQAAPSGPNSVGKAPDGIERS
jgi:hypothetical protein